MNNKKPFGRVVVLKENENINQALRRFKKKVEDSGILDDLRAKEFYEKPTTERKRKKGAAPDSSLRPVRGITELADIAVENFKQEIYKEFRRRQARLSPELVLEKLTQRRSEFIKTMSQG
jgi:small subunit ribosomal protein S21